jgi:hypothetical protein
MKKLQCELCGSVDIIKVSQDEFQCQHCGCKYSANQVREIISGEIIIRQPDFQIVGGKLIRYSGESDEIIVPDTVSVIGESAFENCSAITKVTLPETITAIGDQAFQNCHKLSYINLPEGLLTVGDRAFYECRNLHSITLPNSLCSIGEYAFYRCYLIGKVYLSDEIIDIGEGAFSECRTLSIVRIGKEITTIPKCAFRGTGIKEITIPEGVVFIEEGAFEWCSFLTTITLPNSLKYLDSMAFGRSLDRNSQSYVTKSLFPCKNLSIIKGNAKIFFNSIKLLDIPAVGNNLRAMRRQRGVCEHCGGSFTGVFKKRCSVCGRPKE